MGFVGFRGLKASGFAKFLAFLGAFGFLRVPFRFLRASDGFLGADQHPGFKIQLGLRV